MGPEDRERRTPAERAAEERRFSRRLAAQSTGRGDLGTCLPFHDDDILTVGISCVCLSNRKTGHERKHLTRGSEFNLLIRISQGNVTSNKVRKRSPRIHLGN